MTAPPSQTVILAVADAECVDPVDLPPLYGAIEVDALDEFLSRGDGQVRFKYQDYAVTVDHQSDVDIEPAYNTPPPSEQSIDARLVMESAREGMSLVRPDGTFVFVNVAFADLFGYERHELLGEHWTVLYHNEEAKRLEEDILPAVRETGYWSGESVRFTKHGDPRVTDHRLALTGEDVILCTATDITLDRTAPQPDPHTFDDVVDDMEASAFFTLDHEGYVTRWGEETAPLGGYESAAILGKHVSMFFPREDQEQGLPQQLLDAAKRDGTASDEGWRVRDDGSQFWANTTLIARYDDAGTIRGFGTVIGKPSDTVANS